MSTLRIDITSAAYVEILPASGTAYGTVAMHPNADFSSPDTLKVVESLTQPAPTETNFTPVSANSVVYASQSAPKWAIAANFTSNFTRDDG